MEFTNLKSIINVLNENKELIVSEWIRKGAAYERLKQNNISPKFFAKHFGVRVTDYALGIITGESKLGNCPVIHVLLQFFKDKNISLSDIFIICAGLKNTLIQIMLAESLLTKDRLDEVAYLMDRNFEGVMKEYLGIDNEQIINKKDSEEQFSSKTETKPKAPIISAYEYINDFSIDLGDVDEMRELEEDAIAAMSNEESLNEEGQAKLIKALMKYSHMLNSLLEFEMLGYSLNMLVEIMITIDIDTLSESTRTKLPILCKAIIEDLQGWRIAVFEKAEAKNIHWMDDGFLSSISQLQIMLMPQAGNNDELELF
jgi:hypothetical protein